jgi:hypothetical protein
MKGALEAMMPYIERELARGTRLHAITRHFVGAFHAVPGARAFRRHLSEQGFKPNAGVSVLHEAIALVALHSDFDGLGLAVRLTRAGVSDQRGPRCCEASLAAF